MSTEITFLGTGGGRHTTMYQIRCTGGMLFKHADNRMLHIDPGPGALTQMHRIHYDPELTESVIVSHAHPDHCSDAPSVIEGMTKGGWIKRGSLYGSASVIAGECGLGPCISDYHLGLPENIAVLRPGDVFDINGTKCEICKAIHGDPTNVGFKFFTEDGVISYVSDTEYSDEIADQYIGTRLLILPVTAPDDVHIPGHLCTEDTFKFISRVKPELAVFIHLGLFMIKNDPDKQAKKAETATGIRTIAGKDLMKITVGSDISVDSVDVYSDDWIPPSSP